MRATGILLVVLARAAAEASSEVITTEAFPEVTLKPPLNAVHWCNTAAFASDADCGPAKKGRTVFVDSQFIGTPQLPISNSLNNTILDIVIDPQEDEALWIVENGIGRFGGLVGDAINALALKGGFRWNAIVVNSPGREYSNWDAWALDWANRADLIAVWFVESHHRKAFGLEFPHSFYDLTPHLLVHAKTEKGSLFERALSITKPFTPQLWAAVFCVCLVAGILSRYIEGQCDLLNLDWKKDMRLTKLDTTFLRVFNEFAFSLWMGVYAFLSFGAGPLFSKLDTWAGRLFALGWVLNLWILRAAFGATLTMFLTVANTNSREIYTTANYASLLQQRGVACLRPGTALSLQMQSRLPNDQIYLLKGEGGVGIQAAGIEAVAALHSDLCQAYIQPNWMASDLLVQSANSECNTRIMYPGVPSTGITKGGYIVAGPQLRATVTVNPWQNPGSAATTAVANSVVSQAIGIMFHEIQSSGMIETWRADQLNRKRTNTCLNDGSKSAALSANAKGPSPMNVAGVTGPLLAFGCLAVIGFLFSFCDTAAERRKRAGDMVSTLKRSEKELRSVVVKAGASIPGGANNRHNRLFNRKPSRASKMEALAPPPTGAGSAC